jgi:uncharacterized membrane protein YoaK (UPF0700 family)
LALLALIAGYVDAYAFLNYAVYGSFMSGNTTQTGLHWGQGDVAGAGYNLLPIPLFVAGVFIGTLLVHSGLGDRLRWLFVSAAGLLLVGLVTAFAPRLALLSIAVLSLAMGMMNTSATSVGPQKISLGFVSGTLNDLARHLALAAKGVPLADADGAHDSHARRALLLAGIFVAFVAGASLAGAVYSTLAAVSLLFPVAVLLWLAMFKSPRRGA